VTQTSNSVSPWHDTLIAPDAPLLAAIRLLDRTSAQICLVVDADGRLLGTVTDGDIRRGILKGKPLESSVAEVMNREPTVGRPSDPPAKLLEMMNAKLLRQIPIVDERGRVRDLRQWTQLSQSAQVRDNWVLLMAGGEGSRLRPLTEDRPKPLLNVGRKPLLESILESLSAFGFRRFYISVRYKAEMVKEHFGDGSRWGCTIRYLEEEASLGTAGALGLLDEQPRQPLIVMNGDVLTKVNFENLLEFHQQQGSVATMCVREFDFKVPYGVVEIENHRIRDIVEKPVRRLFVNAGIYVLDPSVAASVPKGRRIDMTEVFSRVIAAGGITAAFPVWEYWIDIGQIGDFERANSDYLQLFNE
jgi:dTDP-glucose pyrophosphorylase